MFWKIKNAVHTNTQGFACGYVAVIMLDPAIRICIYPSFAPDCPCAVVHEVGNGAVRADVYCSWHNFFCLLQLWYLLCRQPSGTVPRDAYCNYLKHRLSW